MSDECGLVMGLRDRQSQDQKNLVLTFGTGLEPFTLGLNIAVLVLPLVLSLWSWS